MALVNNKELLEYGKFRDLGSGLVGIAVTNPDGSNIGGGASVPAAAVVGQKKIAATGTAVQLTSSSNALVNGVIVTALSTNVAAITVGGSGVTNTIDGTGNGVILQPGQSASFAVANTNALYINGTINDLVSFAGS